MLFKNVDSNFFKFVANANNLPFTFDFSKYAYESDPMEYLFESWKPYYNTKYHLCKSLAPKSILEIGVRYGYSAVAFLNAAPKAAYVGIDNDSANPGALEYARELLSAYNVEIILADTQSLKKLPGGIYDLIHVDGQQNGDSTFHDLELALEQGRYILVDGYFWSTDNMLATTYFMQKYKEFIHYSTVIPGYAGELLIKVKAGYRKQPHSYTDLSKDYNSQYYLSDCGGYDTFIKSNGKQLDPRLESLIVLSGEVCNKNILDIGCGRGELTNRFFEMGANAVGVDYSKDAVSIARSTFAANLSDKLQYVCEDVLTFSEESKFQRIIMADVVEHIESSSLDKLLQKSAAILSNDGYVLIHTAPNRLFYDVQYANKAKIFKELDSYIPKNPRSYYEDLMHINEQTPTTLKTALEQYFNYVVVWTAPYQFTNTIEFAEWFGKDCPYEILCSHYSIYAIASHTPDTIEKFANMINTIRNYQLDANEIDIHIQALTAVVDDVVRVRIRNNSTKVIQKYASNPISFSYHVFDNNGNTILLDGQRTGLIQNLHEGSVLEQDVVIDTKSLQKGNEYKIVITLVQEYKFWFDGINKSFSCEVNFSC